MLNKVILQGRLVADPELKQTTSGIAVVGFRLAVDRDFKSKETGAKEVDFISCTAFRQTAELISRYFSKGSLAIVDGRLQVRGYEGKDGNKRTAVDVLVSSIYFGGSKGDSGNSSYAVQKTGGAGQASGGLVGIAEEDGELPF